jgi:hypothetical protein
MKSSKPNPKRVLAIDPTSRGFGFVVIESPTTLVDWGVKTMRQTSQEKLLAKALQLIRHYRPETLVLEDQKGSRRRPRIRGLLGGVCRLATAEGLKSSCVPVARVKQVFGTFRANTKQEIAHVVAQQLPELAPHLPPYRKAWMSEDYYMAVFDAAALALTYYNSRLLRSGGMRRAAPESIVEGPKPLGVA